MTATNGYPELLRETIEFWKEMSDDDLEAFEELPPYMQEHIKRLAYYADQVPGLLANLKSVRYFLDTMCRRVVGDFDPIDYQIGKLDSAINRLANRQA